MSIQFKHYATVTDRGTLEFQEPEIWSNELSRLRGKKIWVTVGKFRAKRSNQQNRYYWAVVVEILSEYFGYTPEEVHDILREKFLRIPGENGKPDRIGSSALLDKSEFFKEYIEKIILWASIDFGIVIPDPNRLAFDLPGQNTGDEDER